MTHGEWQAVLQYLEEKNNSGRQCICHCSQCTGTYTKHRAYINSDGDFVLSKDTLMSLLSDYKYTISFDRRLDPDKSGYYFNRYWNNGKKDGFSTEERRVIAALVKMEYDNEEY